MSHKSVVLFDFDGTLIDSVPDLHASLNQLLVSLGRRELTIDEVRLMIGEGAGMLVKRALLATGRAERWRHLTHRFLAIYDDHATRHTRPYPGAEEALRALQGRYPLALCTNKPERPTRQLLQHLGWTRYFDAIVGGDSLPERKPHPQPVLHLVEALGSTPARALLVGDSPADAGAAQAAGVCFVAVPWGYSRDPIDTLPSVAVLDRFGDLPGLVKSLLGPLS